jgi:tetratricopeptide (TPR) repeat protein
MIDFYTPRELTDIKQIHLGKKSITSVETIIFKKLSIAEHQHQIKESTYISQPTAATPDLKADFECWAAALKKADKNHEQGQLKEAQKICIDLIQRYQSREEPGVIQHVIKAMHNLAVIHGEQDNIDSEQATYEDLIARYQIRQEPEIIELVVRAMLYLAMIHGQRGDAEKALIGYENLVSCYKTREELEVIKLVVMASINQGNILAMEGNWSKAENYFRKAQSFGSGKEFQEHEVLSLTILIGISLTEIASELPPNLQSNLAHVFKIANQQPAKEERLTLAVGIGAVLPTELALSIIHDSGSDDGLQPLIVALKTERGEKVRASEEVLEIASDVIKRMEKIRSDFASKNKLIDS